MPSLITMIGRNVVSAAFDLDFRSPRHSARKPASEFAPPTSTPNSVRWTATPMGAACGASGSASSAGDGADATTSGIGAAMMAFAGFSGSIRFCAPPHRAGPSSISRPPAGRPASPRGAFGPAALSAHGCRSSPGACCRLRGDCLHRRLIGGLSAGFVVATGDTAGAAPGVGASDSAPPAAARSSPEAAASGLRRCRGRVLPGNRAGHRIQALFQHGDAGIQPVAVAIERIDRGCQPPGLVLAFLGGDWICCAWRARSAAATCSRRNAIEDWLASTASDDGADRGRRPMIPSRHSARRSKTSSSARKPVSRPPVFSVSKLASQTGRNSLPCDVFGPPEAPPESRGKH